MPLYIVLGQQRACMPVYIGKSWDLVRCYWCLTHSLTHKQNIGLLSFSTVSSLSWVTQYMWKIAKRQPICMLKPAYNFLNHTFNSFNSTGQKMLQTCPSLAKLLPNCDCLNFWWAGFKSIECCSELCLDNGSFWCLNCFCNTDFHTTSGGYDKYQ